ncbi:MAG: hypothetical protein QUS14_11310 [Pyrinomonadaceae bacterium]|nr:hypothetical protein [Pyrinomonadaceae bacterium]
MYRVFGTFLLLVIGAVVLACGEGGAGGFMSGGGDTPTAAYKKLYEAVKSKNTEAIKAQMTKKTQEFALMVAQRNNTPQEKVFENGLTATTFAPNLPEIRDERISGDMAAVEVWNERDKVWEDLGFVKEDGAWKLAIGEMWAGTFKSPGKGRAQKEREAANSMGNNMIRVEPPANMNAVKPVTPVERAQPPAANAK